MKTLYEKRIYPNAEGIRNSIAACMSTKNPSAQSRDTIDERIVRKWKRKGLLECHRPCVWSLPISRARDSPREVFQLPRRDSGSRSAATYRPFSQDPRIDEAFTLWFIPATKARHRIRDIVEPRIKVSATENLSGNIERSYGVGEGAPSHVVWPDGPRPSKHARAGLAVAAQRDPDMWDPGRKRRASAPSQDSFW